MTGSWHKRDLGGRSTELPIVGVDRTCRPKLQSGARRIYEFTPESTAEGVLIILPLRPPAPPSSIDRMKSCMP